MRIIALAFLQHIMIVLCESSFIQLNVRSVPRSHNAERNTVNVDDIPPSKLNLSTAHLTFGRDKNKSSVGKRVILRDV
jgi:hypothetical protein